MTSTTTSFQRDKLDEVGTSTRKLLQNSAPFGDLFVVTAPHMRDSRYVWPYKGNIARPSVLMTLVQGRGASAASSAQLGTCFVFGQRLSSLGAMGWH